MSGPWTDNLDASRPNPPSTSYLFIFPSFIEISNTDDKRPPYWAGILPLIRVVFLMASELNMEKKPNRCPVL
jgi:hypothetical protein